jgi:dihydroorotase
VQELTIRAPDDFHVHLRSGERLRIALPFTAQWFPRCLTMPNDPMISNADSALKYRADIRREITSTGSANIAPMMTLYLTQNTSIRQLEEASRAGVLAGKLYPAGVTTGSQNGVTDFEAMCPIFAQMEKIDMVLSVHGQIRNEYCLWREQQFLPILCEVARVYPNLRIVLEHISTADAVATVLRLPRTVAATITAHHLVMTLDDILTCNNSRMREGINPHNYCQPVPQSPVDRDTLCLAATSGNPKFFFGSDSAPHLEATKLTDCGCAGVFSAPTALPVVISVFEKMGALDKLEAFLSENGAKFYGLPLNKGTITFRKEPWTVTPSCGGIVPFMYGKTLDWNAESWKP